MKSLKEISENIKQYKEKKIEVQGWVRNNRGQKKFGFINLNDGTRLNHTQIVYEDNLKNFSSVQKVSVGSLIKVTGLVKLTPNRPQPFEILATSISILNDAGEDFPIQAKRHSREFLREVAYLRPRTNLFNAIFRVRSKLAIAIHKFFDDNDFLYIHTPILTSNDGEGAGEMFTATTLKAGEKDHSKDFFGKKVFLTVTGQLHAEAFAQSFKNVYTFGPTFRSEASHTPTHAAEFWMIEPEMAFTDLEGLMDIAEKLVKYVIKYTFDNCPDELTLFDKFVENGLKDRLNNVLKKKFARLDYKDAIDVLIKSKKKFDIKPQYGGDLSREHEKYLTDEYIKGPVFVTNWPKDIKAFYMRLNDDKKTVAAVDLLVPLSGELIGGSQREERYDLLTKRMKELKMHSDEIKWYINLRKYGGSTSSGFGLGFERLVMFITGIQNIRDAIPFPRTHKNCNY